MSDETTEKSSKVWLYLSGGIVALPLIYWLSLGPAEVLWTRKMISSSTFEIYCMPWGYFIEHVGIDFGIGTYMQAWFSFTGTPLPR